MGDKKLTVGIVVVGVVVAVATSLLVVLGGESDDGQQSSEVISQNGLHWHAQLAITVKGQPQQVPADIGLGSVHNPIHTHDPNGEIHMEFASGQVTKSQLKLSEFFKAWNQPFTATQLMGSQGGRVTMLVNAQPNTEYGDYQMKDKDKIELRYD